MNFKTSRVEALEILENYVDQNISTYAAQRNFDFGPQSRKNISCLSPYITCLLYTSPSPRDGLLSRMPSSA